MTKCYDLPDCDCGPTDSYWFEYCRLHEAAPVMFEALLDAELLIKTLTKYMTPEYQMGNPVILNKVQAAIAKAKE